MKYLSINQNKRLQVLRLFIFMLALISCKKEVVEVHVDAFAQLTPQIEHKQGTYTLQFTLQEYNYKEVGVRLATSKNNLHKNVDLTTEIANQISLNRYAVFSNTLAADQTYYYQIYVQDAASAKVVYSDVFSFTTNH